MGPDDHNLGMARTIRNAVPTRTRPRGSERLLLTGQGMKALILDGARTAEDDAVGAEIGERMARAGWEVTHEVLRGEKLAYCQGCFGCWVKTPGVCKAKDGIDRLAREFLAADRVLLLSPVTFGGYSSPLKKTLDRFLGLVSPYFTQVAGETHHVKRYARYPALQVVGITDDPTGPAARLFRRLALRNAINLHAPRVDVRFVGRQPRPEAVAAACAVGGTEAAA